MAITCPAMINKRAMKKKRRRLWVQQDLPRVSTSSWRSCVRSEESTAEFLMPPPIWAIFNVIVWLVKISSRNQKNEEHCLDFFASKEVFADITNFSWGTRILCKKYDVNLFGANWVHEFIGIRVFWYSKTLWFSVGKF